jgi:hypothetical protein
MAVNVLLTEEVMAFFERYRAEFDKAHWVAFTSLLHEPFVTVRGDGSVNFLGSRAEARQFFETVANTWRCGGHDRCATSNFEAMPMGRLSRLITFDWELLRADGSLLRKWCQSYQLILVQNE